MCLITSAVTQTNGRNTTHIDGINMDHDSSLVIATRYGLDSLQFKSQLTGGGEIFRTRPDQPWRPSSLLYNVYRVFPGGKAAGT